ncbi:MAG: hypothetical protein M1823_006483, partial [Watsoniomyces obsoletus]
MDLPDHEQWEVAKETFESLNNDVESLSLFRRSRGSTAFHFMTPKHSVHGVA